MLSFFTDPYEDEILYGTIGRYHYYSGNVDYKDTLIEIFGTDTIIPTVAFPSRLGYLAKQFPSNSLYTDNYFIQKHSLFPLYQAFLPEIRKQEIIHEMKYGSGIGIYTKIGMVAGGICNSNLNLLSYCPICIKQDIENYGEPYFHRNHQVQGVHVCYKHECFLKPYPIRISEKSRITFIRLEKEKLSYEIEYEKGKNLYQRLLKLSRDVNYLLEHENNNFNQEIIHKKILYGLNEKGFLTCNNNIKQSQLHKEFIKYYGKDFLDILESIPDENNEYNWLKVLTRKFSRVVHPIRHILLIEFLYGDCNTFFETANKNDYPFGPSPWYCLNPAAKHYKQRVVYDCNITPDYKTRKPIATFTCTCGFIYARKGPDETSEDKFRIGRVKQFGKVWEERLKLYLLKGEITLRGLARKMKCDPKTILKYADKMNLRHLIDGHMKYEKGVVNPKNKEQEQLEIYRNQYENDILIFLQEHPDYTRHEIRQCLKKQYAWFYRNDWEWLNQHFPKEIPRGKRNIGKRYTIDWDERDREYVEKIKKIYQELLNSEKPIRITISIIGHCLGRKAILEKHLDKLPITKQYLMKAIESIEDFQIRRIEKVCKELCKENKKLRKWMIVRKAGLRSNYSRKVEQIIQQKIEDNL